MLSFLSLAVTPSLASVLPGTRILLHTIMEAFADVLGDDRKQKSRQNADTKCDLGICTWKDLPYSYLLCKTVLSLCLHSVFKETLCRSFDHKVHSARQAQVDLVLNFGTSTLSQKTLTNK